MTDAKQVPALIVSGFLGSGKTSLVRWLLEQAQAGGTRVAVISNEFGELGIDRALLGDGNEHLKLTESKSHIDITDNPYLNNPVNRYCRRY